MSISIKSSQNLQSLLELSSGATGLREFSQDHFMRTAAMVGGTDEAPFVRWPVINKEPDAFVPHSLSMLARSIIDHLDQDQKVLAFGIPGSATWMSEYWEGASVFPQLLYPTVLKPRQLATTGKAASGTHVEVPVRSYTQNKQEDGSRGIDPIYIFEPEMFDGAVVMMLDDAVAQGYSIIDTATFLKGSLGVREVHVLAGMTKLMQGGVDSLRASDAVDSFQVLVAVKQTSGVGGGIELEKSVAEYNWSRNGYKVA